MSTQSIFLTAKMARDGARNNILIHNEIRMIEDYILKAVNDGFLSIVIENTIMTTNINYYMVWLKRKKDKVLSDQMEQIKKYFTNLGYNIVQKEKDNKMVWQIDW